LADDQLDDPARVAMLRRFDDYIARCSFNASGAPVPRVPHSNEALEIGGALDGFSASSAVEHLLTEQRSVYSSFFRAIASSEGSSSRARLIALGGSLMAGAGCNDGIAPPESAACTYPKRLVDLLRQHGLNGHGSVLSNTGLEWNSLAVGGRTTVGMLPELPAVLAPYASDAAEGLPTLLLLDFSVNDAADSHESVDQLSASLEAMLRYLLSSMPEIGLMVVQTFPALSTNPLVQSYPRVCGYYGVPLLRYPQVMDDSPIAWKVGVPGLCCDAPQFRNICDPHPKWQTHDRIAVILHETLRGMARVMESHPSSTHPSRPVGSPIPWRLPRPLSSASLLAMRRPCINPLSLYSAVTAAASSDRRLRGVRISDGQWAFGSDSREKPGWSTEGPEGSTIEFDLAFGAVPRAHVSFVRSYKADFGVVELRIKNVRSPTWLNVNRTGASNVCRLNGRRTDGINVTQSAVLAIKADDERMQNFAASCKWEVEFQGIVGFAVPPHSNATLSVRLMEGTPCSEVCPGMRGRLHSQSACTTSTPRRFKILAVASC
jgi:hypothetical protein